jgi:hypothetical protein
LRREEIKTGQAQNIIRQKNIKNRIENITRSIRQQNIRDLNRINTDMRKKLSKKKEYKIMIIFL